MGIGLRLSVFHSITQICHVPALSGSTLLDVLQEGVVLSIAGTDNLHVDLFLVTDEEDHVAVLFVLFDLLEGDLARI